jgi:hypothetical protein
LARFGRGDGHLDLDGPGPEEDQRRLQGQLLDHREVGLLGGPQGHLDEGGAGQDHGAEDGVAGEPRMGGEGEAAGEEQPLVRGLHHRAEKWVTGVLLPERGRVSGSLTGGDPVALALEGVGRERDPAGARVERRPVDLRAGDVGPGEGRDQSLGLGAPGAQGRDQGGRGVVRERRGGHRGEDRVGPELHIGGGALPLKGRDRVGEAHRGARLGDPVGGVGGLPGGEDLAGNGGDDRDPGLGVVEGPGDRLEVGQHRVDQGRVEGVGDREAFGAGALLLECGLDLEDRVLVPGDHRRAGGVDRRQ